MTYIYHRLCEYNNLPQKVRPYKTNAEMTKLTVYHSEQSCCIFGSKTHLCLSSCSGSGSHSNIYGCSTVISPTPMSSRFIMVFPWKRKAVLLSANPAEDRRSSFAFKELTLSSILIVSRTKSTVFKRRHEARM